MEVNVKINGRDYKVEAGTTVLEAARKANVDIPTLCYLKDINEIGACRLCLVEVSEGGKPYRMVTACVYPVSEGMSILTNTPKINAARKTNLELVLSNHEKKCLTCVRSTTCELQKLCNEYHVDEDYFQGEQKHYELDTTSPAIIRDNNKCILCRRCVAACKTMQGIGVIGANDRGFDTHIGCDFEKNLGDVACVNCGQCIVACPVGALYERDDTDKVREAIADPTKKVYICTAPSVRAQIGECFGYAPGTDTEPQMVEALKMLGFDGVFDMNLSADLTIIEEANELIGRIQNGGKLPMITSCSPGWIKYCEHYFPDFTDNLSTCKSPQQMFGAVMKTYFAEKNGIDPKDIFFVSAIPCTAKKFEVGRDGQSASGYPDVDVAITTREVGRMIQQAGIDFRALKGEKFDKPFDIGSGAGAIFGATGGVMEAALRTVYEVYTGKTLPRLEFTDVRGLDGIKEATIDLAGFPLKVCVAHTLGNARILMDKLRAGELDYHVVEVMACPCGCIGGAGQPYHHGNVEVLKARARAIYREDEGKPIRKSHENPDIQKLYREFLGEPLGERSEKLLHTKYFNKAK